jgi:GH24 family phage-related lysozyme (muramidase)
METGMSNTAPISLEQVFRYYKGLPHQAAAIEELARDLQTNGYAATMRRDRPWFKTWSQDGKQTDLAAAIALVKEFEGCHLSAYPDPLSGGDPWTIGYGTTRYQHGAKVQRGDKITVIEADLLLRQEIDRIAAKLATTVPHWKAMDDNQRSALVSFAYNLGPDFVGLAGFETITRCLRDRDWAAVPAAMELYRNPGTNVEAGLLRRRRAEGKLWGSHAPQLQQEPAKLRPTSPFNARITPHIRLGEFALDQEARRFNNQGQVDIAAELATFLERVRTQFGGKPVVITSGYRPPAVNASVGGASNSEHLYKPGCGAVDFYIDGADIRAVQRWCDQVWPYSVGYGAPKGFVHLGIRSSREKVRWVY